MDWWTTNRKTFLGLANLGTLRYYADRDTLAQGLGSVIDLAAHGRRRYAPNAAHRIS